ncbi:hypothetical protein N7509_002485 [Penicillium cosmopolitanum]|uniref:F-box domain-containing protein n=1 Tax=Penicillium cosmopolitanum TaxID=1131564 RepID=A0A9W9W8W4_9EURO|nr:uncharacterized protein N7509_002485 [Penicillium cosmopolitanum]KAJ5408602.1 hypothetical protein N7509_002485 [Penicillium cosmopolitanum]
MPRKEPMSIHLPPEVIHIITGYLVAEDLAAVFSLARASKTYYAYCQPAIQQAVKSIKFHDIKIAVPRPRREVELKGIVKRLIKRLEAADGFGCVRRVFVAHPKLLQPQQSRLRAYEEEDEWKPPCLSTLLSSSQAANHTTQYGQWQETPLSRHPRHYGEPDRDLSDDLYNPVVKLIKILPNLTDLIWTWSNCMPPCILDTLRRDQPQCRLLLDYFFNSPVLIRGNRRVPLYDRVDHRWYSRHWRENIDVLWHSAPSLHSISIGINCEPPCENLQRRETLLRAVTSAPNLKDLRFRRNEKTPVIPSGSEYPSEKLSLETLHFESRLDFHGDTLYGWSHYTDFLTLQTLKIHGRLNNDVFGIWDRANLSFPSLRTLSLNIGSDSLRSADFYNSANSFLHSLPPLTDLELEGWHSLISIDSLVAYHGPHLRKLKLSNPAAWQFVNEEEIRLIDGGCPSLEELGVPLNRRQDETDQFILYLALGSFKNLSTLHLHYEILPPRIHEISREAMTFLSENMLSRANMLLNDLSFDEFQSQPCGSARYKEHQLQNGHVERIIVDSIVDKKLACEIFQVISDAKPLESVKLKDVTISTNGSNYGHDIAWIVDTFTTAWHVREVSANSRDRETLIVAEELQPTKENSGGRNGFLPEWIEPIFQRLFPGKQSKGPPRKISKKLAAKRQQDDEATPTWRRQLRAAVPAWSLRSSSSSQGKERGEKRALRSGKASWGILA